MALAAGISRPPVLSITTRAMLCFFKVFDSMGDTFGIVGFGFGFRQRRNGDDEVSFGDVDACVIVLGTHHKSALHSVVVSGNCPVMSMGCLAAP